MAERSRGAAKTQIVVGVVLVALAIAVSFYAMLGFVVISSTGVASAEQETTWNVMGWASLVAFVIGVALVVRGVLGLRTVTRS